MSGANQLSGANCHQTTCSAQLEFVQILVIVMVMMVMVVVITCLLNHYRLSARSLLSRHGPARRPHLPLTSEGGLWSSEGPGSSTGLSEQVYSPRPPERVPSYLQRERLGLGRFQPTYPYLPQSLIDLPPTISLSDGEEPPPYQGPCTLQLRDPEQQLELNRESVRAPPNRTVYDSHLLDSSHCSPAPPSLHPGLSASMASAAAAYANQGARVQGAPPTYSEVIGHYYHPSSLSPHSQQTGGPPPPPSLLHGLLPNAGPLPESRLESRNARNTKEKQKPQQV